MLAILDKAIALSKKQYEAFKVDFIQKNGMKILPLIISNINWIKILIFNYKLIIFSNSKFGTADKVG